MGREYKHYRLSKIIDLNSKSEVNFKALVGRYHTFYEEDFKTGNHLTFRNLDDPLGFQYEGEIKAVRHEIIRKREYIIISTKIRDFYLTEYQRQG